MMMSEVELACPLSEGSGMALWVREMQPEDAFYVGTCSHLDESEEWVATAARRVPWLQAQHSCGLRVLVALVDGEHAGLLYALPIEMAPCAPLGRELMVIQCLWVPQSFAGQGVGHALMAAAEQEARRQGKLGLAVTGYRGDFWFMPATFFEHLGFQVAAQQDERILFWKPLADVAEPPTFRPSRYRFVPVPGKVVVDLFWTHACQTIDTEAQRVREVVAEFGDRVILREYCADDPVIRDRYGLCRGIYIDGREIGWGYEAPREGLREAIRQALGRGEPS